MRSLPRIIALGGALLSTGCVLHQTGPVRPIAIDADVAMMRGLALSQSDDVSNFYNRSSAAQASIRSQIVTARMYVADLEYRAYEARLTKDNEEEGLAA